MQVAVLTYDAGPGPRETFAELRLGLCVVLGPELRRGSKNRDRQIKTVTMRARPLSLARRRAAALSLVRSDNQFIRMLNPHKLQYPVVRVLWDLGSTETNRATF